MRSASVAHFLGLPRLGGVVGGVILEDDDICAVFVEEIKKEVFICFNISDF